MPKIKRPYSRVYWEVLDDPKFEHVWPDDRALATWVRLLIAADMAWPASAALYHGVHRPSLDLLVGVHLVDMQAAGRYRIHGLDKERELRSDVAREAVSSRYARSTPVVRAYTDDDGMPSTEGLPSQDRAKQSRAKQSRAEDPPTPLPSDDDDHLDAWYRLTASWPSAKVLPWLNELAANHGPVRLSAALAEEIAIDDDRRSLLSRTQTRLEASAHAAEKTRRKAEADQAAAERARIDAMPPEQRAANMARLHAGMVAAGLITADERGTR